MSCLSLDLSSLVILTFVAMQMQDFMRMYSNLVERCFNSCCNDFTSKALSSKEVPPLPAFAAGDCISVPC